MAGSGVPTDSPRDELGLKQYFSKKPNLMPDERMPGSFALRNFSSMRIDATAIDVAASKSRAVANGRIST
jgi:hypothetical protein